MADLVTHLCSALLPKALIGGRHSAIFALGTAMPDVVARVPGLALALVLGDAAPEDLLRVVEIAHQPLGSALICCVCVWVLPQKERLSSLAWLVGGAWLHLALDLLQDHQGHGYYVFAPFSMFRFELGCVGSEATVQWAPWLALLTAAAWAWRWWRNRRA
ncbi:MAG: membrane-bound metal-dependent hydrolase YbcI (DUF457 family) [Kiritimatiellia bacterium]